MDFFLELAQKAVEEYVKNGKILEVPKNLPERFYNEKAGVFVTIYKKEKASTNPGKDGTKTLRGCVGTILPTRQNIAEEIISSAVAACAHDNRFKAIQAEELPDLEYEVSVLSPPEKIVSLDGHDPQKYGLIVQGESGGCGLLLPNLDGVETAEQQWMICCQKGGIDPFSEKTLLFRFSVEKHAAE